MNGWLVGNLGAVAFIAMASFPVGSLGAVLELSVDLPGGRAVPELPACEMAVAQACTTTLPEAVRMIQSSHWQASLTGRYSRVRLRLAPGLHRLTDALGLRWGQGLTQGIPLDIEGTDGSSVVSGAVPVPPWSQASMRKIPARVVAPARDKLLVADLSTLKRPPQAHAHAHARGFGLPIRPLFTELFVAGTAQPLAGWPNAGYGTIARPGDLSAADKKTFSIEGRLASDWLGESDLRVQAYWGHNWASQSYPVSEADPLKNTLTLPGDGSPYGIRPGQRIRVEDALVELDAPGEWYVDRASDTLYYWPTAGAKVETAEISVAPQLLQISDSEHVTVKGLTFEKTTGDAVQLVNSGDVVLDNVTIRQTGNRGLVILNSVRSGVRNSLIEDNGEGGVHVSGGDRTTLLAAGNFVDTSVIRRYSRLAKTTRHAVELEGVGHRIHGNTISDGPHSAILFSCNDHVISGNEIFNVVQETGDAGAIYVGRDFTVHGTVIEYNFLHDIRAQSEKLDVKGIYIDDQASGITVRCNVFARVDQPVFLGGGRDNVIENNLFFESSPAVHLDARGLASQREMTLDPKGTLQRNLDAVLFQGPVYASRFPHLARIRDDDLGAPKYNIFRGNTIISGSMTRIAPEAKLGIAISNNRRETSSFLKDAMSARSRNAHDDIECIRALHIFNPSLGGKVSTNDNTTQASPVSITSATSDSNRQNGYSN